MKGIKNMEEVNEESSKVIAKKTTKKKSTPVSKEQMILSKMLACDKCELKLDSGIKIRKTFVDALEVFKDNPEHLSIVLEEALGLINIVKLSDEYSKKISK